jgi:uncharacterized protein
MSEDANVNHLVGEKSPYLRQHAHNPVDWYPWGKEAFERAKAEDKPIFLSIGYATCHWCHVMAHETFENQALAKLMNETFINVKVDREELPHVDSLYMEFAQAMLGGGGGWPLNLVLTPELKPVFAATYMPPEARAGMLGMRQVVERVRQLWSSPQREQLFEQADRILETIEEEQGVETAEEPLDERDRALLEGVAELYYQVADATFGGIQGAPKFPMPFHFSFMLRHWRTMQDSRAVFYVSKSLEMMQRGGIHDHLGGGFSRYSVDAEWTVPHFEKMLYDNALLARAYTEGWQATENGLFRATAEETLDYLLREMRHQGGAFFSAQDSDSEGEEGKFYTWTFDEVIDVLGDDDGTLFCDFYDLLPKGNFNGRNVIHQPQGVKEFAEELGMGVDELGEELAVMRGKLFAARQKRVHPPCDEKIIVGWNGLAIRAFAEAAFAFGRDDYREAARAAARFIEQKLWKGGRLFRRFAEGEAGLAACSEDYAFLIGGLLSLFKLDGNPHWLSWAIELSNVLSEVYKSEEGAFYRTDGTDENLLVRQVEFYDGAEPSGNATHCENLLRLYQITGAERFMAEAEAVLQRARPFVEQHPLGSTYSCLSLSRYLEKNAPTLVVALNEKGDLRAEIGAALGSVYAPNAEIVWRTAGDEDLFHLVPGTENQEPIDGKTTLYLCREGQCEEPVNDPKQILEMVKKL